MSSEQNFGEVKFSSFAAKIKEIDEQIDVIDRGLSGLRDQALRLSDGATLIDDRLKLLDEDAIERALSDVRQIQRELGKLKRQEMELKREKDILEKERLELSLFDRQLDELRPNKEGPAN